MLLPSALGSSPLPPVSVYGTGMYDAIAAFLDSCISGFATIGSLPVTPLPYGAAFPAPQLLRLARSLLSRVRFLPLCPHISDHT